MASEYLFVYGTLKRSFNHPMHPHLLRHAQYVDVATLRGLMYRVAHYPGVIESDEAGRVVHGELYRVTDAAALFALLDDYEECSSAHPQPHEYERTTCLVSLSDGSQVPAWVYLYAREVSGLEFITTGCFG